MRKHPGVQIPLSALFSDDLHLTDLARLALIGRCAIMSRKIALNKKPPNTKHILIVLFSHLHNRSDSSVSIDDKHVREPDKNVCEPDTGVSAA